MCAGAVVLARIPRVVFGAWDEKAGAAGPCSTSSASAGSTTGWRCTAGVREQECGALLRDFFAAHRA